MTARPPRLRFKRDMRIKLGRDFSRARREGRRLSSGCMIANWRALPTGSKARLGVITTKALGNAVIRARVRRLLREAWRLHQHELNQAVDMVLVAHRSIVGRKFAEVEGDYVTALRRAGLLKTS